MLFPLRISVGLLLAYCAASEILAQSPSEPPDPAKTNLPAKLMALEAIMAKERNQQQTSNGSSNAAVVAPIMSSDTSTASQPVRKQNAVMHAQAALRINATRGDYTDAIISAESLALVAKSPKAKAALNDLIDYLSKLRAEQETQAALDVNDVLTHATAAVVSAKNAKDLDPVLIDIGAAMDRNRIGTFTSSHLSLTAQLADADRFIKEWQNYLFDKEAGNRQDCLGDLERLVSMGETFRPIPRSQLLELYRSESSKASPSK